MGADQPNPLPASLETHARSCSRNFGVSRFLPISTTSVLCGHQAVAVVDFENAYRPGGTPLAPLSLSLNQRMAFGGETPGRQ